MNKRAPVSTLPRIVRYLETVRALGSNCPHCGAQGSVIHYFKVEDGRHLGAMSGCVQLFPASPIAAIDVRLRKKAADYAGRDRQIPSWDEEKRRAIDDFYEGLIDERQALARIRDAEGRARTYRIRRGWR